MPLHLLDLYLNCVQGLAEELALPRCWCRHVGRSTILLAESRCHLLRAHGTTYVIPATTIPVVLVRMDSGAEVLGIAVPLFSREWTPKSIVGPRSRHSER